MPLALDKAKELAVDHFAGHQEVLTSAMGLMAKYKARISTLKGLEDLPKKMPNAMKGKPLKERLLPGSSS